MTSESDVIGIIKTMRRHKGLTDTDVDLSSHLYEDGQDMDSLAAAELSGKLEKMFGKDPTRAVSCLRRFKTLSTFMQPVK